MEEITITVENYFSDAGGKSLFSDSLADLGRNFNLGASFETFRGSRHESLADLVVDYLDINLLVAAEDRHTGTCGGARHFTTDTGLDFISSLYL